MTSFHTRCAAYALMALVALVGTASQLPQYLPLGLVQGNVQFWSDTLANPPAASSPSMCWWCSWWCGPG